MTRYSFEVVMAGSVFKGISPVLKDAMLTVIHRECPLAIAVMPIYEPVVGALLLGMELDLPITENIYQQLDIALENIQQKHKVILKLSGK
jgi:hypothetical protein